jgi:hypothetical protein
VLNSIKLFIALYFYFFSHFSCVIFYSFKHLCVSFYLCVQGLGTAVDIVLPHAEHRVCIRHLHANCKVRGYTGKAFKDEIWEAARATNVYAFDEYMQKIYEMDKGAHTYLSGVPKQLWSRHAFNCETKSDILLNNLAECFNA